MPFLAQFGIKQGSNKPVTFVNAALLWGSIHHPTDGIMVSRLVGLNVVPGSQILIKMRLYLFGRPIFEFLVRMEGTEIFSVFGALNVRARVCACVESCNGITARGISEVLGLEYAYLIHGVIPELVRLGLIGRTRSKNVVMYHGRKLGRRFVREELARIENEQRAALDRLIATGRAKEGLFSPDLEK